MIKVHKHLLTCDCSDCLATFPKKRFEAVWQSAEPDVPALAVRGRVPIGHADAPLEFKVWVTPDGRLATDWPGFPGSAGARVEIRSDEDGDLFVARTRDPVLMAMSASIPLRRSFKERMSVRCTYELGLSSIHITDYIPCDRHVYGLPAMTCRHVLDAAGPIEVVVLYGVDGDYPDVLCPSCVERVARRDLADTVTVCSRCQQEHLYRHHIRDWTYYGANTS
ncbi:MAG: hypothetical protein CSA66_05820 [Proteobacteria bacterium]|nr:MAG: hypothetical protein CSA66_05820 [Pseudomonadota bacterium]